MRVTLVTYLGFMAPGASSYSDHPLTQITGFQKVAITYYISFIWFNNLTIIEKHKLIFFTQIIHFVAPWTLCLRRQHHSPPSNYDPL
jgi:hypothetical protein